VQDPYGLERYAKETARLYGVMDKHLAVSTYFADDYSIADIAIYPWVARHPRHKTELADFPHVKRWYDLVGARPAVRKGMAVPFEN
jgi:GST-like protein